MPTQYVVSFFTLISLPLSSLLLLLLPGIKFVVVDAATVVLSLLLETAKIISNVHY